MGLAALVIVLGYLLGSIPSAYIILRVAGKGDIRDLGTGNVGTLNAYQQMGPAGGLGVLVADVAKGALAVLLPTWIGAPDWAQFGGAVMVVAGHNWPIFLGFRGGKGAATILGVGFALAPFLALIALIPVVLSVVMVKNAVVGAILGFILFDVLTVVSGESWEVIAISFFLTIGVIAYYIIGSSNQIVSAIRRRHWRSMVFPE